MLTSNDLLHLKSKGISEAALDEQLNAFVRGFPYLGIRSSATVSNGIVCLGEEEQNECVNIWESYLSKKRTVVKFVPASGAASRMFKDLYAFLSAGYDIPTMEFEKRFFGKISQLAFYESLNEMCLANEGKDVGSLMAAGQYKTVVRNLLERQGLDYGSLPKGLLLFHRYGDQVRTAAEEHLAEGAMYAKNASGEVRLHFTVSPEHLPLFEHLVAEKKAFYEQKFQVKYDISFSTQHASTDTIAVDMANAPFRDAKGRLLFRPGGHGALIRNLDAIDADVVFIKNIDNVVPDALKGPTVHFKKVIAGVLVSLQKRIFEYVKLIESGRYTHQQVQEMLDFLRNKLYIENPETEYYEDAELVLYIKGKLMRPLRVCGMVRNVGEPGGGPFLTVNQDGTVSLQILESSQIDMENPNAKAAFEKGSHFNPVDLVCALKDVYGRKYNLPDYVDKNTGFISKKSKDGRDLKALELPGLWNGAMSDWNTVFVEVPIETFNPVKTVNDLLRETHL